jgi:ribonuclease BN (tRNA processing enzyme)
MPRSNIIGKLNIIIASAIVCLPQFLPTKAEAQAVTGEQKVELVMLGTGGGPILRKDRSEPASLLIVDGTTYLIDCGVGTLRRMVEAGIDPSSPKTVFISHHHFDHDLELVSFLGNAAFSDRWKHVSDGTYAVYGPQGTEAMVAAAIKFITVPLKTFAAEGLGSDADGPHFEAHDISGPGLVYQDDKIRVTAMENSHYDMMPSKQRETMKSYSFRIYLKSGSIVYTGDTGPSAALTEFAQGADVVITEVIDENAMVKNIDKAAAARGWPASLRATTIEHMQREHSTPQTIAQLATDARVGQVILTHFVPGMDNDGPQVQSDVTGVKANYKGIVTPAHDLARYCAMTNAKSSFVLTECSSEGRD